MIVRPTWTIDHLRRLGNARDRAVDDEMRTITIDDDDAQRLVAYIEQLEVERPPKNSRAI